MKTGPDPRFEAFAAREPYFAVLTSPDYLTNNLSPDHEREFFASGEELVDWMFSIIDERIAPHFSPMTMLEYGCGVGRLAIPLARRPGTVVAVDRSPAMLDVARRTAAARGAPHVVFEKADELWASGRTFDFICCVHVLQRLPKKDGVDLLRRLLRQLASGGIAVCHVPYRTSASAAIRSLRWGRERIELVNATVNALRRKSLREPYIPAHTYDLNLLFQTLDDAGVAVAHVAFQEEQDLSSVVIFVERPLPSTTGVDRQGRRLPGPPLRSAAPSGRDAPIDVNTLIAQSSPEALQASAETYFSSLTNWDDHLAKPFSAIGDAPRLLANLAVALDALRLHAGATVLEFGAGTGWLSRQLTQLGCHAILLDVSTTALDIARELYRRLPVVGSQPAPQFQVFNGRTIDLADATVDRIVTFDAFHHVPNPHDVLREFGRVLRPGGIAVFSEPGARHSRSPMSQFEMRTYGVVENDIDVHALWRTARACGFADVRVAIFNGPPFYVSLEEYEDFLAAGQTTERWLTATRVFQRDVRNFLFVKEGQEPADSRSVRGLRARIDAPAAVTARAGEPAVFDVVVTNDGTAAWLPASAPHGGVRVGAHLHAVDGRLLNFDFHTQALPGAVDAIVHPGDRVSLTLTLPVVAAGKYRVEIDCVAADVAWFAQLGSPPARVDLTVGRS